MFLGQVVLNLLDKSLVRRFAAYWYHIRKYKITASVLCSLTFVRSFYLAKLLGAVKSIISDVRLTRCK